MKLWLLVPAKAFEESKSRLADVLTTPERAALSRQLLTHVIKTAQQAGVCEQIAITSRDRMVLAHAAALGTHTVREQWSAGLRLQASLRLPIARACGMARVLEPSLNNALDGARQVAVAGGADAVLVLPADLPWVQPEDIRALYAAASAGERMIIVPSRDGGTNALLLRPPDLLQFGYGRQSFQRHCQAAHAAGIPYKVVQSDRLAFDLDQPQDLARWQAQQDGSWPAGELCQTHL